METHTCSFSWCNLGFSCGAMSEDSHSALEAAACLLIMCYCGGFIHKARRWDGRCTQDVGGAAGIWNIRLFSDRVPRRGNTERTALKINFCKVSFCFSLFPKKRLKTNFFNEADRHTCFYYKKTINYLIDQTFATPADNSWWQCTVISTKQHHLDLTSMLIGLFNL